MKKTSPSSFRIITAALGLVVCLLANHAWAALTTWDPQGTTTTPVSAQGFYSGSLSGTWENADWSTAQAGQATPQAWIENTAAVFATHSGTGTPAFTITMNANHTVAGIFSGPLTYNPVITTISGTGTFILGPANLDGFDLNSNSSDPGYVTYNVPIAGGASAVYTSEGSGQHFLNAVNTYSGGTTLGYSGASFSGIMNFNNSASFGTGFLVISNTSSSICALAVEGTSAVTIPNHVFTGLYSTQPQCNIVGNPAGVTFSGPWTLNANAVIGSGGAAANLVNISGVIANGSGSAHNLQVFNPGILELSGNNTFTGNIIMGTGAALNPGTLEIGGAGTLGYVSAGVGSYAGTIYLTNNATGTLPGTFLYASSANQTLSGVISGGGNLTVTAGTLNLTGVDTYTGLTTVGPGTLNVGSGSLTGGGAVTVKSGGTFGVAGTIAGPVTVNSGGTLSTSAGTGVINGATTVSGALSIVDSQGADTLTFNNSLALSGTTTLGISAANSTADSITVGGANTVTLGGTLTLSQVDSPHTFAGNPPTVFQVVSVTAAGSIAGNFTTVTTPTTPGLTWNTTQLTTPAGNGTVSVGCDGTLAVSAGSSQAICAGNSVTLTATPSHGTGTYASYSWSPGGATTAAITVSPASTTIYTVTVTDSAGCTATSLNTTITVNDCTPPVATGIGLDVNGNISLTVTGGVGTVWALNTNNNVTAPLPWPTMTNGTIPSSPFTITTYPPSAITNAQLYYYLTNVVTP